MMSFFSVLVEMVNAMGRTAGWKESTAMRPSNASSE